MNKWFGKVTGLLVAANLCVNIREDVHRAQSVRMIRTEHLTAEREYLLL